MTVTTYPGEARYLGAAIDPLDQEAGLKKAISICGEERVRRIAEQLSTYNGRPIEKLLSDLSAAWYSSQPMAPALKHLKEFGADVMLTVMSARMFARLPGNSFNPTALDALSPGVRALSGLPTRTEIDKARLVADALRDSAP